MHERNIEDKMLQGKHIKCSCQDPYTFAFWFQLSGRF